MGLSESISSLSIISAIHRINEYVIYSPKKISTKSLDKERSWPLLLSSLPVSEDTTLHSPEGPRAGTHIRYGNVHDLYRCYIWLRKPRTGEDPTRADWSYFLPRCYCFWFLSSLFCLFRDVQETQDDKILHVNSDTLTKSRKFHRCHFPPLNMEILFNEIRRSLWRHRFLRKRQI